MKFTVGMVGLFLSAWVAARAEAPIRAVVLDFEDQTGQRSDALLGGAIEPGAIAEKGVFLLAKVMTQRPGYVLIDRRDLLAQMDRIRLRDDGAATPAKPSFLQAAQALRADVVLRGSLLSLSPGKQIIHQGGIQTELSTLSVRVALEALDARDGTIIAAHDGIARQNFRQTAQVQTALGEDEVIQLVEKALNDAVPELERALQARALEARQRPTVALSIQTSADPALVELDGILIGTTPIRDLQVYQGDHVLTIGKPGHQQVTKRILLEKDTSIEVPMLRTELTAEELKDVYDKIQLKVIQVEPGLLIHTAD